MSMSWVPSSRPDPGNLGGLEDAEEMALDATAGVQKNMLLIGATNLE
jgi:hypothetical protein